MGIEKYVKSGVFPKQNSYLLNRSVEICIECNDAGMTKGKIVRADIEEPYVIIIHLENGQYVLGSECRFNSR